MNDVMGTALFLVLMGIVWIADRTLRRDADRSELDAYERAIGGGWG